jgi:hypothetical protein
MEAVMPIFRLPVRTGLLACFLQFAAVSAQDQYILIGWNDLGMHCANRTFANLAVLPPYNNVHSQVIRKGDASRLPAIVTGGLEVTYEIPGNTYSAGKTDFWTYAEALFGAKLADNVGLKGNGLSGDMKIDSDGFLVEGIPLTPYTDSDLVNEDAYQLGLLKAYDSGHALLASAQPVIPVSNEINCVSSGCHTSEMDILNHHENEDGFDRNNRPILCASCHASNALGTTGRGEAPPLSQAVHGKHGEITNDCYNCHPGKHTKCLRDVMYSKGYKCQDCHGSVSQVGSTVAGGRRPWLDEPRCGSCHASQFAEETGKLYRQSRGHGGLYCSACHGSPHAIQPTVVDRDNVQNIALQGFSGPLRDCTVCHGVNPTAPGPHGRLASDVREHNLAEPGVFGLGQNYPNPFNPATVIPVTLLKAGKVRIDVFNNRGQWVSTPLDRVLSAGEHRIPYSAGMLPSGVYSYRLTVDGKAVSRAMVVEK